MRAFALTIIPLTLLIGSALRGEQIGLDRQIEIITNYMVITGQVDRIPPSFSLGPVEYGRELKERPHKCGTPAIAEFRSNRYRLDKDLLESMSLSVQTRPDLPKTFDSPLGRFKIHYRTDSIGAVLDADKDSDGDGVPDYVESVAGIFDYVHQYIIDTLGFPVPPDDSVSGGDARYDIYVDDVDVEVFGYTFGDELAAPDDVQISSYIVIDNNYENIPVYRNRPLDAVAVTAAHEYFHAVQFGIDSREFEIYGGGERRYWMEMSATWMEEEIYDDVNDYYYYLPFFFDDPRRSIQQFRSPFDLRPYGAVVFPIYLSERFGRDIIRDIWMGCGDVPGPNFLLTLENVLDTIFFVDSTEAANSSAFSSMFAEFALWNFFTGLRAEYSPVGIGYEEKAQYLPFPNSRMAVFDDLPFVQQGNNRYNPDHNAASYYKIDQLQAFQESSLWANSSADSLGLVDTTFWRCIVDSCTVIDITGNSCEGFVPICCVDSVCVDSVQLFDLLIIAEGIQNMDVWRSIDTSWCYGPCQIFNLSGTTYLVPDGSGGFNETLISNVDSTAIDSVLSIYPNFDPSFKLEWGLSIIFQMNDDRGSFEFIDTLADSSLKLDIVNPEQYGPAANSPFPDSPQLNIINPRQYRSVTLVLSPASWKRGNYKYQSNTGRDIPIIYAMNIVGLLIDSLRESSVDYSARNVAADVLLAYPNPAVIARMNSDHINIQYQVPTDNLSRYVLPNASVWYDLTIDVFTVTGEQVRRVATRIVVDPNNIYGANNRRVIWESQWDMRNDAGQEVASGVYLILARLYSVESDADRGGLVTEKTTKVVVIR